jgi:hypothetical protein
MLLKLKPLEALKRRKIVSLVALTFNQTVRGKSVFDLLLYIPYSKSSLRLSHSHAFNHRRASG